MKKNKTMEKNPTTILLIGISLTLLGINGVIRLINAQSTYDVIIGIALTVGLIGGFLSFRQYLSLRKDKIKKQGKG